MKIVLSRLHQPLLILFAIMLLTPVYGQIRFSCNPFVTMGYRAWSSVKKWNSKKILYGGIMSLLSCALNSEQPSPVTTYHLPLAESKQLKRNKVQLGLHYMQTADSLADKQQSLNTISIEYSDSEPYNKCLREFNYYCSASQYKQLLHDISKYGYAYIVHKRSAEAAAGTERSRLVVPADEAFQRELLDDAIQYTEGRIKQGFQFEFPRLTDRLNFLKAAQEAQGNYTQAQLLIGFHPYYWTRMDKLQSSIEEYESDYREERRHRLHTFDEQRKKNIKAAQRVIQQCSKLPRVARGECII